MIEKNKVDLLIKAIPKLKGTGIDLRTSDEYLSLYYEIKDARNTARNIERKNQLDEEDIDPHKHWRTVCKLGQEILESKSKDLEIACWLTESWLRLYGFNGLIQGFNLLEKLIGKYQLKLYPRPDEEGLETTLAALTGLNGLDNDGSLIQPIRNQYITDGYNHGPYALWQYQQSLENSKIKDINILQKKVEAGAVIPSMINKALEETNVDFYRELKEDINQTIIQFNQLQTVLDKTYGKDQPPSSKIKNILEDFKQHIIFITHSQPYAAELEIKREVKLEKQPEGGESKQLIEYNLNANSEMNRELALAELAKISAFFKKTEPHSPLSYAIDRIIRWGNLPLPELMHELIKDAGAKQGFFDLTGLPDSQ